MTTRNAGTGAERPATTGALGFGAEAARDPGSEAAPGRGSIYTESELRTLIERGEGQFLEFKSAWDRSGGQRKPLARRALRDKIAEVVAAFANADGGVLLVGVEDDGAPSGHGYPEEVVDGLLTVETRLDGRVSCRAARGRVGDFEVLVFATDMAPEAVMVEGNGFPYRVGAQIVRERQETIDAKKQAYWGGGYEPRFDPDATLEALDLNLVGRFMDRTPLRGRSPVEALRHYGLIEHGPRDWRLTNAALLLFGQRAGYRSHPRAGIRLFRVAGTERLPGRHRNVSQLATLDAPIADALRDALLVCPTHIRRVERFNGMRFDTLSDIPDFALREAIVNAVAHRDYGIQERETEVWFFEDRVEVESPGGVVPPATEADLREGVRTHSSRNPLLVRALSAAGYMRDEGEGVARIHNETRKNSLPRPEIAVEGGIFVIRLFHETGGAGATGPAGRNRRPRPSGGEDES